MWWRLLGKGEIGDLSESLALKLESKGNEEPSSHKMGLGTGDFPRKNKVPKTERSLWILGTDKISVCLELHGYYKIWLMPSDRWQAWRRQTYKQIVTYIMINTEQRKVQMLWKKSQFWKQADVIIELSFWSFCGEELPSWWPLCMKYCEEGEFL